eukprot:Platyproteum_vivax@DN7498_c0_g1_i6.p1
MCWRNWNWKKPAKKSSEKSSPKASEKGSPRASDEVAEEEATVGRKVSESAAATVQDMLARVLANFEETPREKKNVDVVEETTIVAEMGALVEADSDAPPSVKSASKEPEAPLQAEIVEEKKEEESKVTETAQRKPSVETLFEIRKNCIEGTPDEPSNDSADEKKAEMDRCDSNRRTSAGTDGTNRRSSYNSFFSDSDETLRLVQNIEELLAAPAVEGVLATSRSEVAAPMWRNEFGNYKTSGVFGGCDAGPPSLDIMELHNFPHNTVNSQSSFNMGHSIQLTSSALGLQMFPVAPNVMTPHLEADGRQFPPQADFPLPGTPPKRSVATPPSPAKAAGTESAKSLRKPASAPWCCSPRKIEKGGRSPLFAKQFKQETPRLLTNSSDMLYPVPPHQKMYASRRNTCVKALNSQDPQLPGPMVMFPAPPTHHIMPKLGMQYGEPMKGMPDLRPINGMQNVGPMNGMQNAGPMNGMQNVGPMNGMQNAGPMNGMQSGGMVTPHLVAEKGMELIAPMSVSVPRYIQTNQLQTSLVYKQPPNVYANCFTTRCLGEGRSF